MPHTTVIIEQTFNAPVATVWRAFTNENEMRKWYFNVEDFKLEVGNKFHFSAGSSEKQYLHLCEITEIIPEKKIAYTWRYDGFAGSSLLTIKLVEQGHKTYLKLTHTDLETFAGNGSDFAIISFNEGWNHIINIGLKKYLESATVNA
jgi:uncharacterized protein YndB with AHSA1/START domain